MFVVSRILLEWILIVASSWEHALSEIHSMLDTDKIQEITRNMECKEALLEMDELDQLETKLFGLIVAWCKMECTFFNCCIWTPISPWFLLIVVMMIAPPKPLSLQPSKDKGGFFTVVFIINDVVSTLVRHVTSLHLVVVAFVILLMTLRWWGYDLMCPSLWQGWQKLRHFQVVLVS